MDDKGDDDDGCRCFINSCIHSIMIGFACNFPGVHAEGAERGKIMYTYC